MKRSSNLKLTIMALSLPAALLGCDEGPPTGTVLSSVYDCANAEGISLDECKSAHEQALIQHERVAPRFENATECNQQFGNCTGVEEEGRTHWVPPMTGFLIGYAVAGGFNSPRRDEQGGSGPHSISGVSPLYRDYRSGDYLKPSGDVAGNRTGNVTGARGNATTPARAITVSRSGFGSSSGARHSFGG